MPTLAFDIAHENHRNSGPARVSAGSAALEIKRSRAEIPVTRPPRKRRGGRLFLAFVIFVTVATAVSLQPWKSLTAMSTVTETEPAESLRMVSIARPAPVSAVTVVLPATIRPWQSAALSARVSGYLKAWHRDLGAEVKAGEALAEIETPELDQQVAEGEALAREADAATVQARAEREEAEADLKTAEAQLVRVQAETTLAKSQLVRREKLLTNRAISQEEFETSEKQVEARGADLAASESDIVRRRANLETRAAIIVVREAAAKSRQANVDRLKELQRFQRIVAPFDGVVAQRSAEVGMLVTAGGDSLFLLEDRSRVRVQINVPQSYSVQTRVGAAVSVSLPESAAAAAPATITRIADSVDPGSRTMLAEIELENSTHRFQPGSYAQVSLTTAQSSSGWTVPTNVLAMKVSGPHVAIVNDQNQIEIKRVQLGRDLGNRVIVIEGLRGNERLVVNPSDDLVDGAQIRISEREASQEIVQR